MTENPFPGMNPYLEHPRLWSGVHHGFIATLRAELNQMLPEQYVADVDERVYVERADTARVIYPDVTISRPVSTPRSTQEPRAVALADPPVKVELHPYPVREPFIQIYAIRKGKRELVTVIELLSPANKTPGAQGRELYLQKQRDLIRSTTHLMEIDLLHEGEHTVLVPRGLLVGREWDYVVCLHKAGWEGGSAWVWLASLRERLPRVSVPLAEGDADVVIDLQEVLNRVYREGRYWALVDYSSEPPVPLRDEDKEWVRAMLREKGVG